MKNILNFKSIKSGIKANNKQDDEEFINFKSLNRFEHFIEIK